MTAPLLSIDNLRIAAERTGAVVVDGVSLAIERGEFLAVVGESGSGKTAAARAVLGLLPPGLRQAGGRITLDGVDLATLPPRRMRALRGPAVGMVFQEPMVSLNPAISIGAQMAEGLGLHGRLSGARSGAAASTCSCGCRCAIPNALSTRIRTSSRAACASASCWPR
jgi:peptide/nickel transport system ATP-binding protein